MTEEGKDKSQASEKASHPTASIIGQADTVGGRIDRYRLLNPLGEGGCGIVYLAEQEQPVRRRVALKVIKPGMDTKQVIARFEAERQALALLDHPHIAHVLDAGTTAEGRPYFVMEYVKGIAIVNHCDRHRSPIHERLQLFLSVCEAIQHAHHKGIIHRDIKPSNILVCLQERHALPKVIDFGVAKAIAQPLTERTLYTEQGQFIGTPEYMSPEQSDMTAQDIDTRSDIYSLGVVLYELLTGVLPYDPQTLREGGIDNIRRTIREEDPKTPSTRVQTTSHDVQSEAAQSRQTDIHGLRRQLHGELDWIVMKALDKDPARRYQTVMALAEDIQRYLKHEPVLAGPPSRLYRMRKTLRKHRTPIVLTGAVALVVISLLGSLMMWSQWTSKSREARALRHETQLSQARDAYSRYDLDSALEGVETLLDSPSVGPQARLLYAGILADGRFADQAIEQLEGLLDEAPEIAGAAHALLGRIYWASDLTGTEKLDRVQEHRTQAEQLLPEQAEAYLLRAITALTIKDKLGFLDRALTLDPQHYESRRLRALTYLASRHWDGLAEDALVMTVIRPGETQGHLLGGIAKLNQQRIRQALTSLDRAAQYTPKNDSQWLDIQQRRCEGLLKLGRYPEVQSLAKTCLERVPDEARFHFYLFCSYTAQGQYERARILFQDLAQTNPQARDRLIDWAIKHVSETVRAGRAWHASGDRPVGLPYLWMLETEALVQARLSQASYLVDNGFHTDWSPDGQKLAFSLGVHGYSGLAVYDFGTQQTELLIVPGKDPEWSPDGKTIAFVRDCQVMPISDLISAEARNQHRSYLDEEVWLINADGTEPRRVDRGGWPGWSEDSEFLYYCSRTQYCLKRIALNDPEAKPEQVASIPSRMATVSPDSRYLAFVRQGELLIQDMKDSKAIIDQWKAPAQIWGGNWLPNGRRFALGGGNHRETFAGLWIYDLDRQDARQYISGRVVSANWSGDAQRLSFCLGPPFYEIWIAQAADLGAGIDASQYAQHMGQLYQNRIKHDPQSLGYHKSLSELQMRAGQYQEAHRSLEAWGSSARQQSVKTGPEWSILMAMSLAQLNRTAEARTHLEQYRQICYRSTLLDYTLIMKMIAVEKVLAGESSSLYAIWDHLENRRPQDAAAELDTGEGRAATDPADQASLQNAGVLCALEQALQHYMQQDWAQLTEALEQALDYREDLALFHSWLALIYAVHPDDGMRQASQALHHATQTRDIMGDQDVGALRVLAAAHAEAGDFEEAVRLEERALELLDKGLDPSAANQAKAARQQLEVYRKRQPSRATQWIR